MQLEDVAAFGGGFVLTGLVRKETQSPSTGDYSVVATPSVWWSRDGSSWSQESPPGLRTYSGPEGPGPFGASADIGVAALTDHALVAVESIYRPADEGFDGITWVSSDGRSWRPGSSNAVEGLNGLPAFSWLYPLVGDGRRCFALVYHADDAYQFPDIYAVSEDAGFTKVGQTGSWPPGDGISAFDMQFALGAAGLVVADYGGAYSYLGVVTGP
jgi:hypothetical protein